MRKLLLMLLTVSFTYAGQATFTFDGTDLEKDMYLSNVQTHTEYDRIPYQDTCHERRYVGTRRVCDPPPPPPCRVDRNGNKRCTPGTHSAKRDCRNVPVYRWVSYICTKYRTVSREVIDYYLNADVNIKFRGVPDQLQLNEEIKVNFDKQGRLSLSSKGTGNAILTAKTDVDMQIQGDQKNYVYDVVISVKNKNRVLSALRGGILNLEVTTQSVSYEIGKIRPGVLLTHKLKIKKSRRFLPDDTIVNKDLEQSDYRLEEVGDKTIVTIDLLALGAELSDGKKYTVSVETEAKLKSGDIINFKEIKDDLQISKKVKVRP